MLSLKKKMLMSGARPLRPQDVFATSLYTGNGGTQTITNGLDLAGKGGLLWTKARSFGASHALFDTLRGRSSHLATDLTRNEQTSTNAVDFLANGFGVGADNVANVSGQTYVAWCIRFARRFAVEVLYTGNGQSGRQIPHGLGDVPGMIAAKSRGAADQGGADGFWFVYHRSLTTPQSGALFLNTTDGRNGTSTWGNTSPTTSTFNVDVQLNYPGRQYVAYLFAHNPDLIQCGSYTGNNSGRPDQAALIELGWKPQFVMRKKSNAADDWLMFDAARGFSELGDQKPTLAANLSRAEAVDTSVNPYSTGFIDRTATFSSTSYIYLAIRAPT